MLRIVDYERIGGIDESTNIEIRDIIQQLEKYQIANLWLFGESFPAQEIQTLRLAVDTLGNALSRLLEDSLESLKEKLLIEKYWLLIKKEE